MSNRKKITVAILISLLFHLAVLLAIGLLLIQENIRKPAPPKPQPLNVVIVSPVVVPAPTPKKKVQPAFINADKLHATKEKPRVADFQSDRNSIEGSKIAGTGNENLPSQNGRKEPSLDFEHEHYSRAQKSSLTAKPEPKPSATPRPTPSVTPKPTPSPTPTPKPTPKKVDDGIAFAHERPTPKPVAHFRTEPNVVQPDVARPGERPAANRDREPTQINGHRFTIGANGVNAVSTPIGRYQKAISDAVAARWYEYIEPRKDLISVGTVHIKFWITRDGHVVSVQTTSNTSNAMLKMYSEQAIIDAKIPPVPAELAPMILENGRYSIEYNFIIYPSN